MSPVDTINNDTRRLENDAKRVPEKKSGAKANAVGYRQRFRVPSCQPNTKGYGDYEVDDKNTAPTGDADQPLCESRRQHGDQDEQGEHKGHDPRHGITFELIPDHGACGDLRPGYPNALQEAAEDDDLE